MKNIIACVLVLLSVNACVKNRANKLIVGMELSYYPFETKDTDGTPMGVSVDLANALGEYLGKEIKIENIAWTGLIPALQTGKIDLIISSMSVTDERKQYVSFSKAYSRSYLSLLVHKDSMINTLEDINKIGKVVAVRQGFSGYLFAKKYLTKASINAFLSESQVITELIQGKADAVLYDHTTVLRYFQKNQDTTRIVQIDLKDEDIDIWAIAVKKDNEQLLTDINQFLVEFNDQDGYNNLLSKYLL